MYLIQDWIPEIVKDIQTTTFQFPVLGVPAFPIIYGTTIRKSNTKEAGEREHWFNEKSRTFQKLDWNVIKARAVEHVGKIDRKFVNRSLVL